MDTDARAFAATAGEDFELCVCIPAPAREHVEELGLELTWVGRVLAGDGHVTFADATGPLAGYEHAF